MAQLHRRISGFSHRRLSGAVRPLALLRFAPALIALVFASIGSVARAADGGEPSAVRRVIPALPKAPSLELMKSEPADLEQLDSLLGRITGSDDGVREQAVHEILEAPPRLVAAIHARMNAIGDGGDKDAMKRLLENVRRKARDVERKKLRDAGQKGEVTTPDYLAIVAASPEPQSKTWRDLVSVLAMSRMLVAIGTVEAVRELIDVYVRFGEFLRVDTQLQLEKLGDKAIAALIETRRHRAEKIAHWADHELDALGKGIPGEAVQTADHQVLADVLRAYGRIKDPDAARIVISFANSERAQVREAARQAVVLMGEVGAWQLRDTYETVVGKRPPRDWSWDRTARELFGEFDRLRLAQTYDLFERGMKAKKLSDLLQMKEAFDKVLARNANFDRRGEMADGYLELARRELDHNPPLARDALGRAERIAQADAPRAAAASLRATLRAEELLDQGIADQTLLRRAIELDGGNSRARELLAQIERGERRRSSELGRWAAAGAIGLVALIAIVLVAFRRGRSEEPTPLAAPEASTGEAGREAKNEPSPPSVDPGKAAAEPAVASGEGAGALRNQGKDEERP